MKKIIYSLLTSLVFLNYQAVNGQTCRIENPTANVINSARIANILDRGFMNATGQRTKAIRWSTESKTTLGVTIELNYPKFTLKRQVGNYYALIESAIIAINNNNPALLTTLTARPLKFYFTEALYSWGPVDFPAGENIESVVDFTDLPVLGVLAITHERDWSRSNRIVVDMSRFGPNSSLGFMSATLHAIGHILNEDYASVEQYWDILSAYNTRGNGYQPTPSSLIKVGGLAEQQVGNRATASRKEFVAELFMIVVLGQESNVLKVKSDTQPMADMAGILVFNQYKWCCGPPVKTRDRCWC